MTHISIPIHYITPRSMSQGSVANSAPIVLLYMIEGWFTIVVVSLAGGTIYRNFKHLCATPESTRKHTSTRKGRQQQQWSLSAEGCQ